jgi:hypothetical protein
MAYHTHSYSLNFDRTHFPSCILSCFYRHKLWTSARDTLSSRSFCFPSHNTSIAINTGPLHCNLPLTNGQPTEVKMVYFLLVTSCILAYELRFGETCCSQPQGTNTSNTSNRKHLNAGHGQLLPDLSQWQTATSEPKLHNLLRRYSIRITEEVRVLKWKSGD